MATGKTNARWIRVIYNSQDVSASVSNISSIGLDHPESDVTAFSDGIVNFTMGTPTADLELSGPLNNTATTGAHSVFAPLNGNDTAYTLTIQIGIRAAPTTGDPEFEGAYKVKSYTVGGDGNWTAKLVPGSATAPAWGTV